MIRLNAGSKTRKFHQILDSFEYFESFVVTPGLLSFAKSIQKNAQSKMANISGEQIKNTIVGTVNPTWVIVAVNVVYAAYQEKGQRRDGSHKITKRTAPAQDYALKKATLEADLDVMTDWINYELKNKYG